MISSIIKRDGSRVSYSADKIYDAIKKASDSVDISSSIDFDEIDGIIATIEHKFDGEDVTVEAIQDVIEDELMQYGKFEIAKAYIKYREKRSFVRKSNTTDDSILSLLRDTNEEVSRENSNKKATTNSTKRDLIAGEVSKDLSKRVLLPKEIVDAHDRGTIHFHDMDYFMMDEFNCCLPNFRDMLENGFAINGVKIDTPKSFRVACNQVTQIMAAVASNQYGGQTFYSDVLGKYLRYTKEKIVKRVKKEVYETFRSNDDEDIDDRYIEQISIDMIDRLVKDELAIELEAGIQTIQYQVNTMYTSNGQSPFVTVFMYLRDDDPYVEEHAMIIEEILKQRIQGLKNKAGVYVTPTFPKLIYVLGENNITPDSKYYYLTKLAAECTAKRMYPDYISEKVMMENYDGSVFGCMGCVSGEEVITYKIGHDLFVESFEEAWNRLAHLFPIRLQKCGGENYYMDVNNVTIWDTKEKKFVKMNRMIKNEPTEMVDVILDRTGMNSSIRCTPDHVFTTDKGEDIKAIDLVTAKMCADDLPDCLVINNEFYSDESVNYDKLYNEDAWTSGYRVSTIYNPKLRKVPLHAFRWNRQARLDYVTGYIESKITYKSDPKYHMSSFVCHPPAGANRTDALRFAMLCNTVGVMAKTIRLYDEAASTDMVVIALNREIIDNMHTEIKLQCEPFVGNLDTDGFTNCNFGIVSDIQKVAKLEPSYDVTTESNHFDVSGIYSHNCRSFLSIYVNPETGERQWEGRFNSGVVTLNLPMIALDANKDMDKFWEIFEDRLSLCRRALMCRHKALRGVKSDVSPIHWQDGAIARLKPGETIDKFLYDNYSSISLGYIGLFECVKYMTGKSHTEDEGREFSLKVMNRLRDATDSWKKSTGIGFALYGTPAESTCYTLCEKIKNIYGEVEGVTDKEWLTNSYHIDVTERIDALSKLGLESIYQKISAGGAISYIEIPNMINNIEALMEILKFMYNNMQYAEFNTRADHCDNCGFDGEIVINDNREWECPKCGCTDINKMYVTRRTCGYLGTLEAGWNIGKTQEINERVLHL